VGTHKFHDLVGVLLYALEHGDGGLVTRQGLACLFRQDQTARRIVPMIEKLPGGRGARRCGRY
jgi:hypothetical protein